MRFVKLLIGEKEGGDSCISVLPPYIREGEGVQCEVTQCTCIHEDGGCSVIMINDSNGALKDEIMERDRCTNELGESTIDRISPNRLIAIVNNNNCRLSRIISDSGCFLTSGKYYGDDKIVMTIMGPNTTYLQNMMESIKREGYSLEKLSSSSSNFETMLSSKQEEALRTAFENGYYEMPRRTNLEQLSKMMNCTKSTLDITLRQAENKIISYYYLGNQDSTRKS